MKKIKFVVFFVFTVFFTNLLYSADNIVLEANKVSSLNKTTNVAEGDVILLYKDIIITANKIIYYKDKNEVEAFDNITFRDDSGNFLKASYIKLNLDTRKGIIENASGFYAPYHYFKAKNIKKIGENSFLLEDAEITTCKGDNPDWSFKTKKARIDYGEYFYSKSVTANIKNIPILYIPYFVWPIKTKRESGFLVPDVGYSSQKGYFITPKYFWNIDVDKDATFGINYFQKNGALYNLELRYQRESDEKIYLYGEYIDDNEAEFIKSKRWRVFSKSNINITDFLEFKFNADYVSDFKYIEDFEYFALNKEIKENKDNKFVYDARLILRTKYSDISFIFKDDMQFNEIDNGYKKSHLYRKPQIIFEKNTIDLKYLNFDYYFDYNKIKNSILTRTISDDTSVSSKEVEREHLKLALYKPLNVRIGTFTPKYTQYYTKWHNPNFTFNKLKDNEKFYLKITADENSVERYIYSINLKFELNEIYKNYKTFKHSIYNSFEYIQTPYLNQTPIVSMIESDIISEQNIYKYTMTHFFNSKNWKLKLELRQDYNLTKEIGKRFEPFSYKIDYKYKDNLIIFKEANYDYNLKEPTYNKDYFKIKLEKFYISTEYIFDKSIIDDFNTSWTNKLGIQYKNLDLSIALKKSGLHNKIKYSKLDSLTTTETVITGIYNTDCWSLGLQYTKKYITDFSSTSISKKYEHIFYILISLKGIGNTSREIYRR